jgi:hypothetical protein
LPWKKIKSSTAFPFGRKMRKVHWVSSSSDVKIGEVVASYSPINTCPDSCSFKEGGCYAWGLFYLRILGNKIDSGKINPKPLLEALRTRSASCKIVRHRVAGDVVGDVSETLNECSTVEQHNLINIGYTHDWRNEVAQPLRKWFRASCNSMQELLEATRMGWSATLAVNGEFIPKKVESNGMKFILCPARHGVPGKKDITCNDCTLCRVDDKTKDFVVMFKVHGNAKTISSAKEKSVDIQEIIATK